MNDMVVVMMYLAGAITYDQLLREVNLDELQPEVKQAIKIERNDSKAIDIVKGGDVND